MGAGFHSINGLKQSVNGKLWSTYVIPRLLYGLEVQELKQSDINQLEQYQRKSLKLTEPLELVLFVNGHFCGVGDEAPYIN